MDPNVEAVRNGEITPEMLRELVVIAQRALGVKITGICDPATRVAIIARLSQIIDPAKIFREAVLSILVSEIGKGESTGNNEGPAVARYRSTTGLPGGAWCATFMSYGYSCAATSLGSALPFVLSSNAKKLTEHVGAVGKFLKYPEPGALICWHRGIVPLWGHVAMVESYAFGRDVTIIQGNVGPYPALVHRAVLSEAEWQKNLYKIAIF